MSEPKRLWREPERGVLAGICVGVADYLDVDVTVVRVVAAVALVVTGFFPVGIAYLVMWALVPRKPVAPPPAPAVGT